MDKKNIIEDMRFLIKVIEDGTEDDEEESRIEDIKYELEIWSKSTETTGNIKGAESERIF